MIKLENFEVAGWDHAIRGLRNPLNSWSKSDSYVSDCQNMDCDECLYGSMLTGDRRICDVPTGSPYMFGEVPHLGPNDKSLMMKLRNAGTDHRKYMRMITVYSDITAPLYWWKEFDTYKVGTVANSCSTMHKIHEKEFTLEDFSHDRLKTKLSRDVLRDTINTLNILRTVYLEGGILDPENNYFASLDLPEVVKLPGTYFQVFEPKSMDIWHEMIQLLPSSYNQKRTVMMNYEVLANMYKSRKNHKLDEWRELCAWVEQLPYSELITGEVEE